MMVELRNNNLAEVYEAAHSFFKPWVTADLVTPSWRANSALDDTSPETSMDSHRAQRWGPVSGRRSFGSGSGVRCLRRG